MTATNARRLMLLLVAIVALISVGFNLYLGHKIVSELRLTPQGVVSDLYPRWRGTHDLLLHGTDPYSAEQTIEYQRGYYGRVPDDPDYGGEAAYQGFAYPLYVSVVLVPIALIPFDIVQPMVTVGFLAIIFWTTRLWTRLVGWPETERGQWIAALLWASAAPSIYLVSLQQLTGAVVGILGLAARGLNRRRYGWVGVVMALAMIKPQLTLLPLLGVLLWARWTGHLKRFLIGFSLSGALLVGASLVLEPSWPGSFLGQLGNYMGANHLWGMLSVAPDGWPREVLMVVVVLISLASCMISLSGGDSSRQFIDILALLIAATLLINQGVLVYNAVLLLFPLALVAQQGVTHGSMMVRLPSRAAFGILVLSIVGGVTAALSLLLGAADLSGVAIDLMGFGFVVAAVPLWLALLSPQLSRVTFLSPAALAPRGPAQ